MDKEALQAQFKAILDKAQEENRPLTPEEEAQLEELKAQIESANRMASWKNVAAAFGEKPEVRSEENKEEQEKAPAVAKRSKSKDVEAPHVYVPKKTVSEDEFMSVQLRSKEPADNPEKFLRSVQKGMNEVGSVDLDKRISLQFEEDSPVYKAHKSPVIKRNGTSVTVGIIADATAGAIKAESVAAAVDTSEPYTTTQLVTSLYTGLQVPISIEMLEDAEFPIADHMMRLGAGRAFQLFDQDAVAELISGISGGAIPDSATTSWQISDLTSIHAGVKDKYTRNGAAQWFMAQATREALIAQWTVDNAGKFRAIGINDDFSNIIIDDNFENKVVYANVTEALAILHKQPNRVFVDEKSEGSYYEVQLRAGVVLRNAQAVNGLDLKGS